MAITKIHPIRRTLSQAIEYIINPKKTLDEIYVSTFACSKESASEEFMLTKRMGNESCFTLAQHLIQSFKPGEVDPIIAHEIGVKLVNQLTSSQHEYVIATHVDKDHIHNHIIFNHTNFVTHKAFRSNMKTVKDIRKLSDDICKEYSLSIIENPNKKGLTKYEWMLKKKGLSYKKILQDNIDLCISKSNSFDEFLTNMQKLGYEIKRGKHIAFRKNQDQRFVRAKSFGEEYTEESIKSRIDSHPPVQIKTHFSYDNSIGLICNVKNYLSNVENPIYRQKVSLSNIKKISATYNYLVANNLDSIDELKKYLIDTKSEISKLRYEIRALEDEIQNTAELLKHVNRLVEYKDIYKKYQSLKQPDSFLEEYYSEILLYETSLEFVKAKNKHQLSLSPPELTNRLNEMENHKASTIINLNQEPVKKSL